MKRTVLGMMFAVLSIASFAQPQGPKRQSTYEQADFVRKELNLDDKQFSKVYSAYEKYNKAVFGSEDEMGLMPPFPGGAPGGRPGDGPGFGGGRPGGGPDFGGGRPGGGGPGFGGQRPGGRPDFNGPRQGQSGNKDLDGKGPKPEDIQKMEKTRAKQEEKLVKSMKKIFKKDSAAFSKWEAIRKDQLKNMFPMPPSPDGKREK